MLLFSPIHLLFSVNQKQRQLTNYYQKLSLT
ncbi:UNVERIFIED_CONTAM: hypothetical protein GTU68_037499 [Idotea baltica]|nr:hypothetical protein [Idotea baltica]